MAKGGEAFLYPPRGMARDEAARYIGVDVVQFEKMVGDARMPGPKQIDGCRVWDKLGLDIAFSALPADKVLQKAEKPVPAHLPNAYGPAALAKRWLCSERHVRNLCASGELPNFKLGGKLLRIRRQDVEDFEAQAAVKPRRTDDGQQT